MKLSDRKRNIKWLEIQLVLRKMEVKVRFYSGYKGDETPRSVFFEDQEFSVDRILQRKRILDPETGESREEYTIKLKGKKAILKIRGSGECELIYL